MENDDHYDEFMTMWSQLYDVPEIPEKEIEITVANLTSVLINIAYLGKYDKYYKELKECLHWDNHMNSGEEAKRWVETCFWEYPIDESLIIAFCMDTPIYYIPENLRIGDRLAFCMKVNDKTKIESLTKRYRRKISELMKLVVTGDPWVFREDLYYRKTETMQGFGTLSDCEYKAYIHDRIDKYMDAKEAESFRPENYFADIKSYSLQDCMLIYEFFKELKDNPEKTLEKYDDELYSVKEYSDTNIIDLYASNSELLGLKDVAKKLTESVNSFLKIIDGQNIV